MSKASSLRASFLAAVSAVSLATAASPALAGAFGLREQSVVGLGDAFAGAASGAAGLASTYWNPATVTMHPGWTSEVNVTYIDPSAKITTFSPTPTLGLGQSGDIGLSGTLPASCSAVKSLIGSW